MYVRYKLNIVKVFAFVFVQAFWLVLQKIFKSFWSVSVNIK